MTSSEIKPMQYLHFYNKMTSISNLKRKRWLKDYKTKSFHYPLALPLSVIFCFGFQNDQPG